MLGAAHITVTKKEQLDAFMAVLSDGIQVRFVEGGCDEDQWEAVPTHIHRWPMLGLTPLGHFFWGGNHTMEVKRCMAWSGLFLAAPGPGTRPFCPPEE